MNYDTLCKLQKAIDNIEEVLFVIAAIVAGVFYIPIYLSMRLYDWLREKRKDYLINKYAIFPDGTESLTRDEINSLVERGKIRISNLPHNRKNYNLLHKKHLYPFHSERKLHLGSTTIAYVENRYSERMHQFFTEQVEWIADFEQWHGVHIVFVNNEELKEGMFFPQDLANCMNHGFLWHQDARTTEPEYDFSCDCHYYVDINSLSDDEIKQQMHVFMSKVHERFL